MWLMMGRFPSRNENTEIICATITVAAYLPKLAEMFGIENRSKYCSHLCIDVLFLLNLENIRGGVTYTSFLTCSIFPFCWRREWVIGTLEVASGKSIFSRCFYYPLEGILEYRPSQLLSIYNPDVAVLDQPSVEYPLQQNYQYDM